MTDKALTRRLVEQYLSRGFTAFARVEARMDEVRQQLAEGVVHPFQSNALRIEKACLANLFSTAQELEKEYKLPKTLRVAFATAKKRESVVQGQMTKLVNRVEAKLAAKRA